MSIYIEKDSIKNILEFLKHFSSRWHHKLFFGPPCIFIISWFINMKVTLHILWRAVTRKGCRGRSCTECIYQYNLTPLLPEDTRTLSSWIFLIMDQSMLACLVRILLMIGIDSNLRPISYFCSSCLLHKIKN